MGDINSCYLCGSASYHTEHKGVRDSADIDVLRCNKCGLVRLSKSIVDSKDFYKNSGMRGNDSDQTIEDILKIAQKDDKRRANFLKNTVHNKDILDFGCGAGGFLQKIQNNAKSISGVELEEKMQKYLSYKKIRCYKNIDQINNVQFNIITMFHVLEHLENPCEILCKLKELLTENGSIIIEVPNADDALISLYKSNAFADFTYWKCHLYLYNGITLRLLAQKCGFKIKFIKYIQRYPLSNHLYWLAKKKPGGHMQWGFLDNKVINFEYENLLSGLGITDTIITEFISI